ncbi:hypothetical protein ACXYTJ_11035 [Gilvimarinus sp. F26214L]|uniref:hypothetical protein n=1 Tax=Gilvimarinus sp. DZF01 TaxID=3461371 RepID=UPI004045AF2C
MDFQTRLFTAAVSGGFAILVGACQPSSDGATDAAEPAQIPVLNEVYMTVRDEADNVDSVAVWHGPEGQHWLVATAKSTDQLIVFDAASGEVLGKVGERGEGVAQFKRPNGISIVDNTLMVVERDNQRVQVFGLPGFTPLGSFGEQQLALPYGLWVQPVAEGYRVAVTDAYETADEEIPPPEELDRRLHLYHVSHEGEGISGQWLRTAGDVEGRGVLEKVESLFGDTTHDRLLVSDESEAQLNVKIYDLDLNFTGQTLGDGQFQYEPEGIALYACPDGSGFWLVADQDERVNTFLAFDRKTLQPMGGFRGGQVLNTDGVWLTQTSLPNLPQGAFFAVHDDGNVGAFDMADILEALGRQACPGA